MGKSLLQVANTSTEPIAVNGNFDIGSVIRRFGCNANLSGESAVELFGAGYYTVDGTFTVAPTAVGNVTVGAFLDGVAIPGATVTGSVSTTGNSVTLPICTTVRVGGCCDSAKNLTFRLLAGAGNQQNVSVRVVKA